MRWIRCNDCYTRAEIAKEPFTLTKCGHAFCSQCIGRAAKQCPICNAVGVATICLEKPLEPHIAQYFMPLKESLQQLVNVANFQEEQIRIMAKRFYDVEKKYSCMKKICGNMELSMVKFRENRKRDMEEAEKEMRKLKNENIQLKFALERAQNSPYKTIFSNPSSASSAPSQERYKESRAKVTFMTPLSENSGNYSLSTNSDRQYLSSLAQSDRNFRAPTSRSVIRTVGNRSSGSAASTGMSGLHGCLQSMTMSDF